MGAGSLWLASRAATWQLRTQTVRQADCQDACHGQRLAAGSPAAARNNPCPDGCTPLNGPSPSRQIGEATATITVGAAPVKLDFIVSGKFGESVATGVDQVTVKLDVVQVAYAHGSGDGSSACMGTNLITYGKDANWPRTLAAGSTHTVVVRLDTFDELLHPDATARVQLLFSASAPMHCLAPPPEPRLDNCFISCRAPLLHSLLTLAHAGA